MTTSGRTLCAVVASLLFYMGLRALRTGRFDTIQGTFRRERSPRLFTALAWFWIVAALFLFAAVSGALKIFSNL